MIYGKRKEVGLLIQNEAKPRAVSHNETRPLSPLIA